MLVSVSECAQTTHMGGVSVYRDCPAGPPTRHGTWAASALLSSQAATGAYRPPPFGGALGWSIIPRTPLSAVIATGLARALRECWVTPEGPPWDPRPVPIPAGQPHPLIDQELRFRYGATRYRRSR
eukprot:gene14712-biopygen14207